MDFSPGPEPTEDLEATRRTVLESVRAYYAKKFGPGEPFVPGETYIRYAGRVFDEDELLHLVDSSLDMWLTAGRYADRFERELAAFYGVRHSSLVNSGSSANLAAVFSLTSPVHGARRLRPGDEVITAACGFPTTVAPIVQAGATPVFVDVAIPSYNVTAEAVAAAVSPRTRAIVLAHTLGNPFPATELAKIAREHDLFLIEDNCDASGSRYDGKLTGTFGDLATLSFYPPHHMTMGEGGAVLTSSPLMNKVVQSFRDWGRDCWCAPGHDNTCGKRFDWKVGGLPQGYDHKYICSHLGFNLKVSEMQAALGCAQLKKLASFGAARRANWRFFRDALAGFEEWLILPEPAPRSDPSWFGFVCTVRPGAPFTRHDIVSFLEQRKVATRMLFSGNLLRQPAFQGVAHRVSGTLETTDTIMNDTFWIGVYPGLTEAMRSHVVSVFHDFFASVKKGARAAAQR